MDERHKYGSLVSRAAEAVDALSVVTGVPPSRVIGICIVAFLLTLGLGVVSGMLLLLSRAPEPASSSVGFQAGGSSTSQPPGQYQNSSSQQTAAASGIGSLKYVGGIWSAPPKTGSEPAQGPETPR